MVAIPKIVNILLHVDQYLNAIITQYGVTTYLFLFLLIFLETGLVFTPFLPGDSLLFATGAFAAQRVLSVWIILGILMLAAVLGDTANYWMGHHFGKKFFHEKKWIKQEYLDKTNTFYAKHGKKTIILARFVPIVRTFAPFVAGIGRMNYRIFLFYNIIGAILWVSLFVLGGYFFGNLPLVQENFSLFILGIVIASFIPAVIEIIKHKWSKRN